LYAAGVLYFGGSVGQSANPVIPFSLPTGSSIDAVRLGVKPTVDNDVNMWVYKKTVNPVTGAITRTALNSSPANVPAGSALGMRTIALDAPEVIDNAGTDYEIFVSGGATVTDGHFVEIHSAQVHVTYYYITVR
jgi:hypothetical protein